MTKKLRVLTGSIQQESHSFNPTVATKTDFEITSGAVAITKARGTNSSLGGIVDNAVEQGVELVVPIMLRAQSGGPVDHELFLEVRSEMLNAAKKGDFDAVVLPLHGGMLTTSLDDPEAELFRAIREVVGSEVPITAAFDLHAHVTLNTLEHCDFLAGYRTNPHSDQGSTGRRAFTAAMRMLRSDFDPVCAVVHFPMLTLGNDETDAGPLRHIHAQAMAAMKSGRVEDISIFNAQQFLDVRSLGQTVVAYGNKTSEHAEMLAKKIAQEIWAARDELVGVYPTVVDCLRKADDPSRTRPLVMGDQGDRVAAGGPGDSTYIFHELMRHTPGLRAVIPLTDKEAVSACHAAGVGSHLTLTLGGRISRNAPPITAEILVVSVGGPTKLVVGGPHDAGRSTSIGPFAVVQLGNITVALTSRPNAYVDPEYFRAMGIEPAEAAAVVTRSGYHFALNYAAVGDCVTVDSPGMTSYRVSELSYKFARPFYPLDAINFEPQPYVKRRGNINVSAGNPFTRGME